MANPNLLNISTIAAAITGFNVDVYNPTSTVLTNPVNSNKLLKISSISISVLTSNAATWSWNMSINGHIILSQSTYSASPVLFPIYMPEGSVLIVNVNNINVFGSISYEVIS